MQKSIIKWGGKKGTTFLNELQIQPITGGQVGHKSSCKQASVFFRRKGQLHQDEPSPPRRATHYPRRLPSLSWMRIKVAFVWQREATRIPITRPRPASSLKHANIKRGIICSEYRHAPGRHVPVSDFGERAVSSHHFGPL